jgi:hypothetical protein
MVLVEVFRNKPIGGRCEALMVYAMRAVKESEGAELKLHDFPCKDAEELGVKVAPALVIDGKIVAEDPTMDEIVDELDSDMIKKLIGEVMDL